MGKLRITIKSWLLVLWREFPLPGWLRDLALFFINHKFIVGVLAIIVDNDKRILLFHHTYIKNTPWGLPGGAAKRESLKEALQRELKEESNFSIEVHNLIGIAHGKGRTINYLFASSLVENSFKASEEVDDFGYFSFSALPEMVPSHRYVVETLLREGVLSNLNDSFKGWIDIPE